MSILHLHLILNHVPVVGLILVAVILAVALWRNSSELARLGLVFAVGLAAVAGIVFLTGEPAEEAVEHLAGVSESLIHTHEEAAEAALIATSLAGLVSLLGIALFWRRTLPRWVMGTAFAVVLLAGGAMGWAANLGGRIRHTEISRAAPPGVETDRDER